MAREGERENMNWNGERGQMSSLPLSFPVGPKFCSIARTSRSDPAISSRRKLKGLGSTLFCDTSLDFHAGGVGPTTGDQSDVAGADHASRRE